MENVTPELRQLAIDNVAEAVLKTAALADDLNKLQVFDEDAAHVLQALSSKYLEVLGRIDLNRTLEVVKTIRERRGQDTGLIDAIGSVLDKS